LHGQLLGQLRQRHHVRSVQGVSRRFRRDLEALVAPIRRVPRLQGDLVLLIDGLGVQFRGAPWVLYLLAVKPVAENRAVFLDPVLLPGREDLAHWMTALRTLPPSLERRIRGLVADDLRGLVALARDRGWVLQLCHFHLISRLQARRGRRKRTLADRRRREMLYQLTRLAVELPNGPRLTSTLERLRAAVGEPVAPARLRMTVRECLRQLHHFRAYRLHPALHLPTTTGAVEAMAGIIRNLLRRTRNISSPQALRLWVTALVRLRPEVTCNGKYDQPNSVV
jgi:hypothetical protein